MRLIHQSGDKSVYVEQNTGHIHIHSSDNERVIIDLSKNYQGIVDLQDQLGALSGKIIAIAQQISPEGTRPKALTREPFLPEVFVGREEELNALHQKLFGGQNLLLLVNGKGGIGKTSLAAKYYREFGHQYQHRAWVVKESSIRNALLELSLPLGVIFREDQNFEDRFKQLFQALAQLQEPCLLVIDNANDLKDFKTYYNDLRRLKQFHLLITTRIEEYSNAEVFLVGGIDDNNAIQLFEKFSKQSLEGEALKIFHGIRKAVDKNTLVLEVLAKNLAIVNRYKSKYTLKDLLTDLQTKGVLQLSHSQKVRTDYKALQHESPENIIRAMYQLSNLEREAIKLLSVFAVLPNEGIPFENLEWLLPEHPNLEELLNQLEIKGWIDFDEAEKSFKCNQVIQDIIRESNDNLIADIETSIEALKSILDHEAALHRERYALTLTASEYATSILSRLQQAAKSTANLYWSLGNFHTNTGDLEMTLFCFQEMEAVWQKLLGQNPDNKDFKNGLAISYSKLGSTHTALGNLQQALSFFEQYTELSKQLFTDYPHNVKFKNDLAISQWKLGNFHLEQYQDKEAALIHFQKAAFLWQELVQEAPHYKEFQNNLSFIQEKIASL